MLQNTAYHSKTSEPLNTLHVLRNTAQHTNASEPFCTMHVLQNTAQHSNTSEPLCTLHVLQTQHNTVTHQNHSVHCACVTKCSNTSEPLCTVHVFQNTAQHINKWVPLGYWLFTVHVLQHNTVTHQNYSVHCACFITLHSTVTHQIHTAANLHCACVTAQHSNTSDPHSC